MMYWLIVPGVILLIFFAIQVAALIALNDEPEPSESPFAEWPKVSILLAARNEEQLIIRNLEALANLDYPKDKLEVLIGNDASTDGTEELVKAFISDKARFRMYTISQTMGKGRGKANVLAHLAHEAKGEFYFITDVDVKLPAGWVKEMVGSFQEGVGIISGTTMCESTSSAFSQLQAIDWLHFMGYIKSFANWGISCTSVGNNMAVRAKAYWETGGFENIDFSITEDYKLFEAVTGNGWEWRTSLNPASLGLAWYIPNVLEMLHQRKRWLIGARDLPANWKAMIILYGLFLPALLFTAFFNPFLALLAWTMKFFFQSIFIHQLALKVGQKPFSFLALIRYEIYVVLNTLITAVFYFLPFASKWKGRTYNKAYIE